MRELLFDLQREHFWDPGPGLGYLRGKKFLNFIRPHLAPSFADTKIPVELAVFDVLAGKTKFLDSGDLAQSVVATCSVPLLFHPVKLGQQWLVDGGVFRKSGMKHENVDERILCIFLESDGWMGWYEKQQTFSRLSPQHKVLRFANLPRVNYNSLEAGKSALREAYERCQRAFDRPLMNSIANA